MGRTRHYATYAELFTQHLEQLLSRGGSAYDMRRAVKMYDEEDEDLRASEFEDWVHATAAFPCGRCGRVFTPEKAVKESQEVICTWCS